MRITVLLFLLVTSVSMRAQETCMQPDVNCDGYVNVNDLLGLLGYFGDEDLDGDGIWDSQDDCVDDGCGVCDGLGPQVIIIDTITFTIDSIFVETINEWYVFEVPDTTFTFVCTNPGCTNPVAENYDPYASEDDGSCVYGDPCGNDLTLTFDGYTYDLVAIGDQCWFAENLRSSMYSNGDSIPRPIEDPEWQNATDNEVGAYAVYDNDGTWFTMYGSLYNWYAVTDPRGLCPIGWHVPSDSEWMILEMNLGLDSLEANQYGWRGTDQGTQMKSSSEDSPSWDGANTSGFSALPGGFRDDDGPYDSVGENGRYWTTDASTEINSFGRRFQTSENRISRISSRRHGFSVRCLKD